MEYREEITLRDGRTCVLRHAAAADGEAMLDLFLRTHAETDFLLTYPEETTFTAQEEAAYLQGKAEQPDALELLAQVEGQIVGSAGFEPVGRKEKLRHRADFGISVERRFWHLGIGQALTQRCIALAAAAGFAQLELEVVADNAPALALYRRLGFVEYGRNPKGFRSRCSGWQEVVLMRLELR